MECPPLAALAALALLASAPLAGAGCGGGTPSPKSSEDVAKDTGGQDGGAASAAEDAGASPAPANTASSGSAASAASADAGSGDIQAPADDPWLAHHQMPPGDVLKTVRPSQAKVQACFRAGVKRDPSTSGEVKIRFVTTNDGVVRDWRDEGSSMTDEEVTKCVGALIKTLKFPKQKSPGDAYGIYSINFTP